MKKVLRTAVLSAMTAFCVACSVPTPAPPTPSGSAVPSEQTPDTALVSACAEIFETPSVDASLAFDLLAAADGGEPAGQLPGTSASERADELAGTLTGPAADDIRTLARAAQQGVGDDRQDVLAAYTDLGAQCAGVGNRVGPWVAGTGAPGTKPLDVSCADLLYEPQTLTQFASANVLPSSMFTVVGRAPRHVTNTDLVEPTRVQLQAEMDATGDEGLRQRIAAVKAPFDDAASGDLSSPGLRQPIDELTDYCAQARG